MVINIDDIQALIKFYKTQKMIFFSLSFETQTCDYGLS